MGSPIPEGLRADCYYDFVPDFAIGTGNAKSGCMNSSMELRECIRICNQMLDREMEANQAYLEVLDLHEISELSVIQENHENSQKELESVIRRNLGAYPKRETFRSRFSSGDPIHISDLHAGEQALLKKYRQMVRSGALIPDIRHFVTTVLIPRIEQNIQMLRNYELMALAESCPEMSFVLDLENYSYESRRSRIARPAYARAS